MTRPNCPHVGRTPPRCCVECYRRSGGLLGRPEVWRLEVNAFNRECS